MFTASLRTWAIRWLWATIAAHLAVGMLMPWMADAAFLGDYHRSIERAFWNDAAPAAARAQQHWWIALFGATVQGAAVWMDRLHRPDRHAATADLPVHA